MSSYDQDLARIDAMVEEVRSIRDRTCQPKDRSNPRYHAFSQAVSGLMEAAADMRTNG